MACVIVVLAAARSSVTSGASPSGFSGASRATAARTRGTTASVDVVQTAPALHQYLQRQGDLAWSGRNPQAPLTIRVDSDQTYQRVIGFGGAMTDSSAWLIHSFLHGSAREDLMRRLFGPSGIALNVLRVPMAASDYTANGVPYSYDDMPPGMSDPTLADFSIAHDQAYVLPVLRQFERINPDAFTIASPWSAPPWMKANDAYDNLGGIGTLRGDDLWQFAGYFVKFIEAYQAQGIPIDAVTPQNENGDPTPYPGMTLSEGSFIANYLRPSLAAAGLAPEIYGLDFNWNLASNAQSLAAPGATPGLSGIAWHCYYGSPSVMREFHSVAPSLMQIVDECSPEIRPFSTADVVIDSLRNWASAVVLWNLALKPGGGPAEPPNVSCKWCRGLVSIDPRTGHVGYSAGYYQLGQVSKFVHSGAQRVSSPSFVGYRMTYYQWYVPTSGLDDVALRNPNGTMVLVVHNNLRTPIRFAVSWNGRSFEYQIPSDATTTFVWK